MRIVCVRMVRGWRCDEQAHVYDLACCSDEPLYLDRIRAPRGGTIGVETRLSRKVASAQRYRSLYAAQAAVREASRQRVYAWRERQRAQREALRDIAREAHRAAVKISDTITGAVTAYAHPAHA